MKPNLNHTEQLVASHGESLRRLALGLVRDDSRALDLVQETWLVATQRPEALAQQSRPGAVLGTILRRLAWRGWRDDGNRLRRERAAAVPEASPEQTPLDVADQLQAAIRRLDVPLREVIVQRYLEGLPPREIARRTGQQLGTVKSRLKRGLAALRSDLSKATGRDESTREWRTMLVGAFWPDPDLSVHQTCTPSLSPQILSVGGLVLGIITMKSKLAVIAMAVAALTCFFWPEPPLPTADMAAQSPAMDDLAIPTGLGPVIREVASPVTETATTDAIPTPTSFDVHLQVMVRDQHGWPWNGVQVQIAPADHPFVNVGRTNEYGEAKITWSSRSRTMEVDVALVASGRDLVGVQRLLLQEGVGRSIEARVPRDQANANTLAYVLRAEDEVNDGSFGGPRSRSRPSPLRGPARLEGGHVLFGTEGSSQALSRRKQFAVVFYNLQRALDGIERDLDDDETPPATIEGWLVDERGEPITGYSVAWRTSDDSNTMHVQTDEYGHFLIESPPATFTCSVGTGEAEVRLDKTLLAGDHVRWHPVLSRARNLMMRVHKPSGNAAAGMIIQARHDDGQNLWIGRGVADSSGDATILDCPTSHFSQVDLIAPADRTTLPIATVSNLSTGQEHRVTLREDCLHTRSVRFVPNDDAQLSAFSTELVVLNSDKAWGFRVPITGDVGTEFSQDLPPGNYWMEIASHRVGRDVLGPVYVDEKSVDVNLGLVPLAPVAELIVESSDLLPESMEVFRRREDVDSLVLSYQRGGNGAGRVVPVREGHYRAVLKDSSGEEWTNDFEVTPGQRVRVPTGR